MDWSRPVKASVRLKKLQCIRNSRLQNPLFLTLPGSHAEFENLIVRRGATRNQRIVGVQTSKKTDSGSGLPILHSLYRRVKFSVFPGDLFRIPEALTRPRWLRKMELEVDSPYINSLWYWLKNNPCPLFNVLDLDFCGSFGKVSFNSVVNLFRPNVLASRGLLFITHLAGREPHWVVDRLKKTRLTVNEFRSIGIPLMYIEEAKIRGLSLRLAQTERYMDGVPMQQYYFEFDWSPKA